MRQKLRALSERAIQKCMKEINRNNITVMLDRFYLSGSVRAFLKASKPKKAA
jgi:hypothetical protein